jgi:hypothetical protein
MLLRPFLQSRHFLEESYSSQLSSALTTVVVLLLGVTDYTGNANKSKAASSNAIAC